MATVLYAPVAQRSLRRSPLAFSPPVFVALCTAFALLLLGYHPNAEDGGIYAAAAMLRLHPALFPAERAFAVAHTGHTLFVPCVALLSRLLHLSLPVFLLLTHVAAVAATLSAAWLLLQEMFSQKSVQRGALVLFAASLGLPIAGTSLYLFDPYVTARSISTPLLLLAFVYLIRRQYPSFVTCVVASLLVHPMMTVWAGLGYLSFVACRSRRPMRDALLLTGLVLLAMGLVRGLGPTESEMARASALTRAYWFPTHWAWYEVFGLLAPPVLLLWLAKSKHYYFTPTARQVALSAVLSITIAGAGAILLVDTANRSLLLARMQPLRLLHFGYLLFLLVAGGAVQTLLSARPRLVRWLPAAMAGLSLFTLQHILYSSSSFFELPGRAPANGYQQAFLWARDHTPADALFALDADYTTSPGEDAQLFRAVALRSSLPDRAKDGGISSVMPTLAAHWQAAAGAQQGLAAMTDADIVQRVRPLGATWIVLPAFSRTHFACPYVNATARVCRLPSR